MNNKVLARAGWCVLGGLAGFAALWAAGINPIDWFGRLKERTLDAPPVSQPSTRSFPPAAEVQGLPPPSQALVGTDSSISKKPLALILTGTAMGRNVHEGFAFIGVDAKNPQTYAAGAILANGARLTQIAKNHVVLERDGVSARLYVQGVSSRGEERGAASQDLLTVGGQKTFKPVVATTSETFTDFIRPSPVYDGEVLIGYQVYPGKRTAVFSRLGLQPGDVITAISDAPLTDPQQTMEIFRQLTGGVAVVATVKRKGKKERLTLDGSIIASELERAQTAQPRRMGALPLS